MKRFPVICMGTAVMFVSLICSQIKAQSDLRVRAFIFASDSTPLPGCYISVSSGGTEAMLTYTNLGDTNIADIDLWLSLPDTLFFKVTHIGFKPAVLKKWVTKNESELPLIFQLEKQSQNLDGITVKGPPVWLRGDTTFHSVEAFKEVGDRKLKDVITKMPGFEVDDAGNLLYKKKMVEKVMIDGEELFSDKIRLMLNSFPIHVLENIQAIENQTSNKQLRGIINGNQVFLNLGLNQTKLKAAFGEGDVSVGTGNSYAFNPIVFSMYGKIKAGFIGRWNTVGQGLDWSPEKEMEPARVRKAGQWLMQNQSIQHINNIPSSRYLRNRQIDNRLQVNIPLSKKVKNNTEFGFISDRQHQQTYNNAAILNGNSFILRSDSSWNTVRPLLATVKNELIWDINKKELLQASLQIFQNRKSQDQESRIIQQDSFFDLGNDFSDRFRSFSGHIDYTKRRSETRALHIFLTATANRNVQNAYGYSDDWFTSFQLPDSSYTELRQSLNYRNLDWQSGIDFIKKKGKGASTLSFLAEYEKVVVSPDLQVWGEGIAPLNLTPYSKPGVYNRARVTAKTSKSFSFLNLPFTTQGSTGLSFTRAEEPTEKREMFYPLFSIDLKQRSKLNNGFISDFNLSFQQTDVPIFQINQVFLPRSLAVFRSSGMVDKPLRNAEFSYAIARMKLRSSIYLRYSFNRAFTNMASGLRFNGLTQIITDSLVSASRDQHSININYNLHGKNLRNLFTVAGGMYGGESLTVANRSLQRSTMFYRYVIVGYNMNWFEGMHTNLRAKYGDRKNEQPPGFKQLIASRVSDLALSAKQIIVLNKKHRIESDIGWYHTNILTPFEANFVLADMAYHFLPARGKFTFRVDLHNIFNEKQYRSISNQGFEQRFFEIPFVGRYAFLTVNYQL